MREPRGSELAEHGDAVVTAVPDRLACPLGPVRDAIDALPGGGRGGVGVTVVEQLFNGLDALGGKLPVALHAVRRPGRRGQDAALGDLLRIGVGAERGCGQARHGKH